VTQGSEAAGSVDVVYLLDLDNSLLDSDRIEADLRQHLDHEFSVSSNEHFWSALETLRAETGFVDYLGAMHRYRGELERSGMDAQRLLATSAFLIDYPYDKCLYPGSLSLIRHLDQSGRTVIFTDGDMTLQPLKIRRSGLWDAVGGRVLVHLHKELMLDNVKRLYPARHYVAIDDELRILAEMKEHWQHELTTVFLRQGRLAADPQTINTLRPSDFMVESLDELIAFDPTRLIPAS